MVVEAELPKLTVTHALIWCLRHPEIAEVKPFHK